jgi:hypothetical protein
MRNLRPLIQFTPKSPEKEQSVPSNQQVTPCDIPLTSLKAQVPGDNNPEIVESMEVSLLYVIMTLYRQTMLQMGLGWLLNSFKLLQRIRKQ